MKIDEKELQLAREAFGAPELEITKEKVFTKRAVMDAVGIVAAIEKNPEQAEIVFDYAMNFLNGNGATGSNKRERAAIEAFVLTIIPRVIGNPKGRYARVLRGFLTPKFINLFCIDPETAAEWQTAEITN